MKQRFDLLDIWILNVVDARRPFLRHSVWQRSEPNKIGLFQQGKGNDCSVLILCEELNSIDNFVPCNSKIGPVEKTDLLALWLNDKVTDMASDEHIVALGAHSKVGSKLNKNVLL